MSKSIFLQIFISPKEDVPLTEIEKKMNMSIDWIRYSNGVYIVYTSSNVERWMIRLKPFIGTQGRLFICELNIKNRNGIMNRNFWNWLKKDRSIK